MWAWKKEGKQSGIEGLIWFKPHGGMLDRDRHGGRRHELREVEPIEKGGREVGREEMEMLFVFRFAIHNMGLDDIRLLLLADTEL
jgi:hypothetical protein